MEGDQYKKVKEDKEDISIHSLRMEGDFRTSPLPETQAHFNPLPPHGGRLTTRFHKCHRVIISIHSLRMEGDSQTMF